MALQPDGPAPYAPVSAVVSIINGYRDRGYTVPFTTDVLLKAGITESLAPRTLQALKLLDLLDDQGMPTATFETLRRARGEDFKACLRDWLYAVYGDVLQYTDATTDPPERVEDGFRGYQPPGQRGRMVTLMLGLFEYAGLIDSVPKRPTNGSAPRRSKPAKPAAKPKDTEHRGKEKVTTTPPRTVEFDGLPPQLVGLLHAVPREGQVWTRDRRDAFLAAFTAVLDFSVPVDDNPSPEVDEDDGSDI